jgi:hypothetical protein
VIRKQLGAAQDKSVARRTAVTDGKPPSTETLERQEHSTGLMRKISDDGISRLEEVDPTAVAAPRARRNSEELGAASSADSGLHRLLGPHIDKDRRTEVGGPPTGTVPKEEPPPPEPPVDARPAVVAPGPTAFRRVPLLAGLAALLVVGGAVAAWQLTRSSPAEPVVAPATTDAAAEVVEWGTVEIDPNPEGAHGHIADVAGVVPDGGTFGPTSHGKPVRKRVEANKPFRVHIELAGYEPYDRERTVKPNETLVIDPTLDRARATLVVHTTPPGAQVTLGGVPLGTTPLVRKDLDASPDAELVITRAGFEPVRQKIALEAGKPLEVSHALKAGQKYGTLKVLFKGGGWGKAYYKGKLIGQVPSPALRLPVGRQTLQLVNDGNPAKVIRWEVTCEVHETEPSTCTTQLP